MSKTDKTDPGWVKAANKNSPAIYEHHNHTKNPCDIAEAVGKDVFWWNRKGSCGYGVSYYGWDNGFYARPPRGKHIRNHMEGSARAYWRNTRHELLKLSREDIEDYDVLSYQTLHRALWEIW